MHVYQTKSDEAEATKIGGDPKLLIKFHAVRQDRVRVHQGASDLKGGFLYSWRGCARATGCSIPSFRIRCSCSKFRLDGS